jgi:hypothetical protein
MSAKSEAQRSSSRGTSSVELVRRHSGRVRRHGGAAADTVDDATGARLTPTCRRRSTRRERPTYATASPGAN